MQIRDNRMLFFQLKRITNYKAPVNCHLLHIYSVYYLIIDNVISVIFFYTLYNKLYP